MGKLTIGAACAASMLGVLHAARALGVPVPVPALLVVVGLSTALAAAVVARSVVLLWRGPAIVPFDRRDGVSCDVAEAAAVRAAAQLRASTGGAGYVQRSFLVFPAVTWAAVAVQSTLFLFAGEGAPVLWPLPAVALGAALSVLFPATAFCYLELPGGCVLVYPPLVGIRIVEEAGVPPALTRFDPSRSGRGASHGSVTPPRHVPGDSAAEISPPDGGAERADAAEYLGESNRCA